MPQADTSTCPRCGAGLRCGLLAGDAACWCAQLPPVMAVPASPAAALSPDAPAPALPGSAAPACFCPACLQELIDERQRRACPAPD